MKTIILSLAAAKDLDNLPPEPRRLIAAALDRYVLSGQGDIKKLAGREGYRMRVGNYRVLFDEDAQTVLAFYIGKRQTKTYRRN